MTQVARHMLPAQVGICGDDDAAPASAGVELRESFKAYIAKHVGNNLTPEQMRTLMTPQALENLVYHTDRTFEKVAGWYMPAT